MALTEEEQKQICSDCFNDVTDRACGTCPAHYKRGGICCFGDPDQYDEDSTDCQTCIHHDDCIEEVAVEVADRKEREIEREAIRQQYTPRYRSTYTPTYTPTYRASPKPKPKERLVQIGGLRDKEEKRKKRIIRKQEGVIMNEDLAPGETLLQRFAKDTIWGAGQGFFEMGAEFFRTHRLP